MPMKPREMEKLILADRWVFKNQEGSQKTTYTQQSPERSRYHSKIKTFQKARKTTSESRRGLNNPAFSQYRRCKLCYQCIRLDSSKKIMLIRLSSLI